MCVELRRGSGSPELVRGLRPAQPRRTQLTNGIARYLAPWLSQGRVLSPHRDTLTTAFTRVDHGSTVKYLHCGAMTGIGGAVFGYFE
jgi:hypothetical protein